MSESKENTESNYIYTVNDVGIHATIAEFCTLAPTDAAPIVLDAAKKEFETKKGLDLTPRRQELASKFEFIERISQNQSQEALDHLKLKATEAFLNKSSLLLYTNKQQQQR